VSLLRRIVRALRRPPRRRRPPAGVATGYQQRLLPDVAEGRVLLNLKTHTATMLPRGRGHLEDVTGDCAALTAAGLITAPPPPEDDEGRPWVVPYELTERGEDALLARRRGGRRP
jgi:hypothetical protein